jgi:hypothetical protein
MLQAAACLYIENQPKQAIWRSEMQTKVEKRLSFSPHGLKTRRGKCDR